MQAQPLEIGLVLPTGEDRPGGATPGWDHVLQLAQHAETVGFDSVWVADHLPHTGSTRYASGWESWSLLPALAVSTRRVKLGALATNPSLGNPALLAKVAATLDEISGGRLILGLSPCHDRQAQRALAYPIDHRLERFEESLQIITGLLRRGRVDFQGTFYQARSCQLRPRGPRPGGLPIMLSGPGRRLLRLAASCADVWSGWLGRERVDASCRDVGRDPATLRRAATIRVIMGGATPDAEQPAQQLEARDFGRWPLTLSGSAEQVADRLRQLAHAGRLDQVQLGLQPTATLANIEAFAAVMARLRGSDSLPARWAS